ncbi:extracellular solute-binding protein [Paenibacillus flagellatus]|nr:extracellular solute-binding protein [Paenibacillus flagellatus]
MKKTVAWALVGLLGTAAALSGCGADEAGQSDGGAKSETSGEAKPGEAKGLPDKFAPPVKLTTASFNYGVPKFAQGDDMNNNPWTRYLKETAGIEVNTVWDGPRKELEQKTNLMMASGDIPDFFLATPDQFAQLNRAGLLEELTRVYNDYATDNIKQVMKDAGPEPMQAATVGGKLMGIPFTGVAKESVPVVWIREDWMKKLGLSAPKSMNDLLAISEAFTTKDPDGNGKHDTFGLSLDKEFGIVSGFLNGFHAYKSIWIQDKDGKLAYSSIQPEMKTALAKLQEMYKAGQIDKEFGVKDAAKVYESFGGSKLGIYYGALTAGFAPLSVQTPNVRWLPFAAPSIDDRPAKLQHGLNIFGGFWVVKKGVKHPEAVLKLADIWLQLFYLNTKDDVYANYNDSNGIAHWTNAPVKIYKPFKNAEISVHLEPLLKSPQKADEAALAKLTPEERGEYAQITEYRKGSGSSWKEASRSDSWGAGPIVNNVYLKEDRFMPDRFITVPTPSMVQKKANLDKMELETFTKIVLGAPLDTFDQFVQDWKRLGGDDMTKEANDWYSKR